MIDGFCRHPLGDTPVAQTIYDSLHNIPLDELSDKVGGRARLTCLVSKRLRMINDGAHLLVERQDGEALLAAVCREIMEDKIWLEIPEPLDALPEDPENLDLFGFGDESGGADD